METQVGPLESPWRSSTVPDTATTLCVLDTALNRYVAADTLTQKYAIRSNVPGFRESARAPNSDR